MTNKELRQLVIDELEYEPSIGAADIGVVAEKDVVTLSGRVTDYAQKTGAERAACIDGETLLPTGSNQRGRFRCSSTDCAMAANRSHQSPGGEGATT